MSSNNFQRSYAAVVAGVKAPAIADTPASDSADVLAPAESTEPPAKSSANPRASKNSKRGPSAGKAAPVAKRAPNKAAAVKATSARTRSSKNTKSSDVADVAVAKSNDDGPAQASAVGSDLDSIPDSGAFLDPEDNGYRGKSANNRVDDPDSTSIIKTRSARAAAKRKSTKSTSAALPAKDVPGEDARPDAGEPDMGPVKGNHSAGRNATDAAVESVAAAESVLAMSQSSSAGVKLQRQNVPSSGQIAVRDERPDSSIKRGRNNEPTHRQTVYDDDDYSSDGPRARKRLRSVRPSSNTTTAVPASRRPSPMGEVDVDMGDAFRDESELSGIEDEDPANGTREGYSSDPGSLKDFIVDDEALSVDGSDSELSSDEGEAHEARTEIEQSGERDQVDIRAKQPELLDPPKRPSSSKQVHGSAVESEATVHREEPHKTPARKTPASHAMTPSKTAEVGVKEKQDKNTSSPSPHRKGRSFGAVIASSPAKQDPITSSSRKGQSSALLDDLYHFKVASEPEVCEVTSPELQDPLLREFYAECPKLRSGAFQSWSEATGPGMIFFNRWGDTCPELDFDTCLSALQFVQSGRYINPARLSPTQVCVQYVPGARPKYHLCVEDRQTAICLSPVMCVESHVVEPPERGLRQKWLAAIFHSQEWERFVSFICMAFGHDTLQAQLAKDAIQFTTRAHFGGRGGDNSSPSKRKSMFSNIRSPSIVSKTGGSQLKSADGMALDFDAQIPVYDCREISIDFAKGVGDLSSYPTWTGEIPHGSFVVVAHTVAVFQAAGSGLWTVSLNLHWAMILGIPSEE